MKWLISFCQYNIARNIFFSYSVILYTHREYDRLLDLYVCNIFNQLIDILANLESYLYNIAEHNTCISDTIHGLLRGLSKETQVVTGANVKEF